MKREDTVFGVLRSEKYSPCLVETTTWRVLKTTLGRVVFPVEDLRTRSKIAAAKRSRHFVYLFGHLQYYNTKGAAVRPFLKGFIEDRTWIFTYYDSSSSQQKS